MTRSKIKKISTKLTSSSSLREALGTADVRPAFLLAAIVYWVGIILHSAEVHGEEIPQNH